MARNRLVSMLMLWLLTSGYCLAAEQSKVHSVEQQWRFQPGDDLAWAGKDWNDSNWAIVDLPNIWKKGGYPEHSQFGWYRKSIDVADLPQDDLGFRMGAVRNAYEIFAGGKLLGGIGSLPPNDAVNFNQLRVYRLPPGTISHQHQVDVAIRVWGGNQLSVDSSSAGPYAENFEVGSYTTLIRDLDAEDLPNFFFVSLFILTGFYFLYVYVMTRANPSFLWFSLTSFVFAVYILSLCQWLYSLNWPFDITKKIQAGSLLLSFTFALQFIWHVVSKKIPWFIRGYQAFFILITLILALSPGLDNFHHVRIYWQLVALTLIVPLIQVIVRETIRGNSEAKLLLFGLGTFIICGINDALISLIYLDSVNLMPVGFLAILVSMAVSLAGRFNTLLASLEHQASARTTELRQVNDQLKTANQSLVEMTRIDPLTGLLNRRGLIGDAEIERQRFLRQKEPLGLMIADIDHFKKFNDEHGHACGDFVLTEVAGLFKDFTRDIDRVARWGGEEFVLLFPSTDEAGLINIAEKLRRKVEAQNLKYEGKTLNITMTFGGAVYQNTESLDDCLKRADAALYRGKAGGRNRIEISQ